MGPARTCTRARWRMRGRGPVTRAWASLRRPIPTPTTSGGAPPVERRSPGRRPADLLLTNHVLLGAPVGAAVGIPFGVKAHGSELEFSLRGNPDLSAWAAETLDAATAVYAGSEHVRRVLEDVVGAGDYLDRV